MLACKASRNDTYLEDDTLQRQRIYVASEGMNAAYPREAGITGTDSDSRNGSGDVSLTLPIFGYLPRNETLNSRTSPA